MFDSAKATKTEMAAKVSSVTEAAIGQRLSYGLATKPHDKPPDTCLSTFLTRVEEEDVTMSKAVHCVSKRDRQNPHERILAIGGIDNGARWKRSQTDAIADVERDSEAYYVRDRHNPPHSVWVIVRVSQWGNKYLTTQADGDSQNNLLSLPECP